MAQILLGDQERWVEVRRTLSTHLQNGLITNDVWTTAEHYTQVQRVDAEGRVHQLRECTAQEYAIDMLESGLDGHMGSWAEWHIVTRAYGLNLVVLTRDDEREGAVPSIERYPVQDPNSSNMDPVRIRVS